jgi:hypothetical protein
MYDYDALFRPVWVNGLAFGLVIPPAAAARHAGFETLFGILIAGVGLPTFLTYLLLFVESRLNWHWLGDWPRYIIGWDLCAVAAAYVGWGISWVMKWTAA